MDDLEYAVDLAQKAIALDDSQRQGHALLSEIYLWKKQQSKSIEDKPIDRKGVWSFQSSIVSVRRRHP